MYREYTSLSHLSLESVLRDDKKNAFFSFSSSRLFLARAFRSCCTFLDATGSHIAIEKRVPIRVCVDVSLRCYRDDKLYINVTTIQYFFLSRFR